MNIDITCMKSEMGSPMAMAISTKSILRVKKFSSEYPRCLCSNTEELIFVVTDPVCNDCEGDVFLFRLRNSKDVLTLLCLLPSKLDVIDSLGILLVEIRFGNDSH